MGTSSRDELTMMKIQILGSGCDNCRLLTERTKEAARVLALDCEIEKVEDLASIISFGVVATPALVIDGQVKLSGFVPHVSKIKEILAQS
jgi:small redox-active disulfide protein 2